MNVPRELTGLAEWLFCLPYLIFLKKNFKGWKLFLVIIGFYAIITAFQLLADTFPIDFWILGMIAAFSLMLIFVFSTAKVTFLTAGYFTVLSFVTAEFAASVAWQIYYFFVDNNLVKETTFLFYSFVIGIYIIIFIVMYLLESRYRNRTDIFENIKPRELYSFLSIAVMIFMMSNISFLNIKTPISSDNPSDIFYIRTLVNLAGIILLYSQREHKLAISSRLEISALESIINKQYAQYLQYIESVDLVNQKYHDLKHQIQIIRNEKDEVKKEQYLDEIERDIKSYGTQFKTGNGVLDVILTQKRLQWIEYNINFTCVADGELLDKIAVMDLCSIFGNALDNAFESVKQISNEEKRIIKVAVFSQKNFLIIRFENYYENELLFDKGNFITTKKDHYSHGYGIKSIKSIIKKYDGNVRITTENNWFRLVILIPLKNI